MIGQLFQGELLVPEDFRFAGEAFGLDQGQQRLAAGMFFDQGAGGHVVDTRE